MANNPPVDGEMIKGCFYQIFDQKSMNVNGSNGNGRGDCSVCEKDLKNRQCSGYFSITVKVIGIIEDG